MIAGNLPQLPLDGLPRTAVRAASGFRSASSRGGTAATGRRRSDRVRERRRSRAAGADAVGTSRKRHEAPRSDSPYGETWPGCGAPPGRDHAAAAERRPVATMQRPRCDGQTAQLWPEKSPRPAAQCRVRGRPRSTRLLVGGSIANFVARLRTPRSNRSNRTYPTRNRQVCPSKRSCAGKRNVSNWSSLCGLRGEKDAMYGIGMLM